MSEVSVLLRGAREAAGLTQSGLARLVAVPQPSISALETGAHGDATVGLVQRLLRGAGCQLTTIPTRTPTVAAVAEVVAGAVRDGRPGVAFRAMIQLNDDLVAEPATLRVALCVGPPQGVGDRRYDAFLAGLVEYRLSGDGLPVPDWVNSPGRFCDPPWDVAGIAGLADELRRATPVALARHGVFIAAGDLASV